MYTEQDAFFFLGFEQFVPTNIVAIMMRLPIVAPQPNRKSHLLQQSRILA
jgi:hypothetical protein